MTSARLTETRNKGPNFQGVRQQEHAWYKASADFAAAHCPLGWWDVGTVHVALGAGLGKARVSNVMGQPPGLLRVNLVIALLTSLRTQLASDFELCVLSSDAVREKRLKRRPNRPGGSLGACLDRNLVCCF